MLEICLLIGCTTKGESKTLVRRTNSTANKKPSCC